MIMKKFKKIANTILACLLIAAVFVLPILADEINDLQEENEELESQIAEERARIDEIMGNIGSIEDFIYELDAEIGRIQAIVDEYQAEADEKQAAIDRLQADIDDKQEEMDKQYGYMKKRIQYFYENGNMSFIDALFSSENIAEALSKLQYIAELTNYDREMIAKIEEAKKEIEKNKLQIQMELAEIEQLKAAQLAQQGVIEDARAEQRKQLDMAYAEKYEAEEAMNAMAAEIEANEERIAEIVAAYDDQTGHSGGNYSYSGAAFLWPLPAPYYRNYITSWFGYRDDADVIATGASYYHSGIDIYAPYNTPIYAVLDGVVVANFWSDGIGNVVALYHGDGLYTEVHHMNSRSPLAIGTEVSQGDVIGYTGATGWYVTGPHLHFGVCLGDSGWALATEYVDPAPYLGLY